MPDQIDDIIRRETGGDPTGALTNDPDDAGGLTKYGISQNAHPELDVAHLTYDQARSVYEKIYILKDHFNLIEDEWLQHQVVDFGVPSGPDTAGKILQQLVGVTPDGVIGPETVNAIKAYPDGTLFGVVVPGRVLLNLAFRDARVLHHATTAKRRPSDLKFLLGWLKRALEFK